MMPIYRSFCLVSALTILIACSTDKIENDTTNEPGAVPLPAGTIGSTTDSGLIFETNFSQNTGYYASGIQLWNGGSENPVSPPKGWNGVKTPGDSIISVIEGAGVDGTNALKIQWDPDASQPTASIAKHLTGNTKTGYVELYIRYHVKLPNKFRTGTNGNGIGHWKWGRLWQNTSPDNTGANHKWTENRENSSYVVWNFSGNIPYTDINVNWTENSGPNLHKGSAGGANQILDYFVSGSDQHTGLGYFESIWDINDSDRPGELQNNTSQSWHTLEFRFKLATTATSDDGIFEMWWDGKYQGHFARIQARRGAQDRTGIPTTKNISGFNFFVFFDNMQGWNSDWSQNDVEGFIYVNDVVISTKRIGHEYVVQ